LKRLAALSAVLGLLPVAGPAGARPAPPLAIDAIFGPVPLVGRLPASITWAPDGSRFLYTLPDRTDAPVDTHVYEVATHRDAIFFKAKAEGKGSRPIGEFVWSPDSRNLAYLDGGDLWEIRRDGSGKHRLARDADDPQWSPDATRIAFVHAGDLFAQDVRGGAPVRYSFDGAPDVQNGDPDWVYSEELSLRHAYAWSPDGSRIAYLRFDERPIAPFPIVDFLAVPSSIESQRYPLAGARNSSVSLRVAAPGGATQTLYRTDRADDYLASVGWTPSGLPAATILDRSQKRLRYVAFDAAGPRALLTETDSKWVDFFGAPRWLADKHRFLFVSERDGQASLYLADARTSAVRRLTRGFRAGLSAGDNPVLGVDESRRTAYLEAAYPTRRDATLLAVPLDGGAIRPLAAGAGSHRFTLAPDARHYVRTDSAFGVPPVFSLGITSGDGLRPFAAARRLDTSGFGQTRLFQIDSRYGKLDAWTILPPDFDPAKKYPVVQYVYGGPAAPTTADAWGGDTYLYHQALAQRGFIVFSVDGPGSQIDTAAAVRRLYHAAGPASLAGQLEGARYLRSLPYVDATRLGIWGWSYGGYETTFAVTHAPTVWKTGVAVAPVTDWASYDSIYTERYMGTPQAFPAAYAASSSVAAAGRLRAHLLISHGTSDDNVHLANSIALLQACVLAGKQVDFMVYPRKRHGISGIPQRRHLFSHMLEYWQTHL
jgi:dipeptidyl-peptidase-4